MSPNQQQPEVSQQPESFVPPEPPAQKYDGQPSEAQRKLDVKFAVVLEQRRDELTAYPEVTTVVSGQADDAPKLITGKDRWFTVKKYAETSGGMGTVKKAWDAKMNAFRAIKMLEPSSEVFKNRDERNKALLRESRALADIEHPNIAKVYDITILNDELAFVMEWLGPERAISLDEMGKLGSQDKAEKQSRGEFAPVLTPDLLLQIAKQVSDASDFLCRQQRAHFDIKPSNIHFTNQGQVKLVDFGSAQGVGEQSETMTIQYVSPEVFLSEGKLLGGEEARQILAQQREAIPKVYEERAKSLLDSRSATGFPADFEKEVAVEDKNGDNELLNLADDLQFAKDDLENVARKETRWQASEEFSVAATLYTFLTNKYVIGNQAEMITFVSGGGTKIDVSLLHGGVFLNALADLGINPVVAQEVAVVFNKALEINPEDRYPHATGFAIALESALKPAPKTE